MTADDDSDLTRVWVPRAPSLPTLESAGGYGDGLSRQAHLEQMLVWWLHRHGHLAKAIERKERAEWVLQISVADHVPTDGYDFLDWVIGLTPYRAWTERECGDLRELALWHALSRRTPAEAALNRFRYITDGTRESGFGVGTLRDDYPSRVEASSPYTAPDFVHVEMFGGDETLRAVEYLEQCPDSQRTVIAKGSLWQDLGFD